MSPATRTLDDRPVLPGGSRADLPPPPSRDDDGRGLPGRPDREHPRATAATSVIGTWLLVGATVILFASFTSTLVVRRAEPDWRAGPVPPLLWVNTAVLLASSAALEWARAGGRTERLDRVRAGLAVTTGLGAAFLAGQWIAWRQLTASGISMVAGPHSAFFYLLTGSHALHVAGGVGALVYALLRARRALVAASAARVMAPVAIYWHFVDVLWLYVFMVLFI